MTLATIGIRRVYPDLRILDIDDHLDLIDEYEHQNICHATVFRRIRHEIGRTGWRKSGSPGTSPEWRYDAREQLLWSSPSLTLPPHVRMLIALFRPHLLRDIDVLDPSAAPGTGCPDRVDPTTGQLRIRRRPVGCPSSRWTSWKCCLPSLPELRQSPPPNWAREAILPFAEPRAR